MKSLIAIRVNDDKSPLGYTYRYVPCTRIGPFGVHRKIDWWSEAGLEAGREVNPFSLTHAGTGMSLVIDAGWKKAPVVALARRLAKMKGWDFIDPADPKREALLPKVKPIVEAFKRKMNR